MNLCLQKIVLLFDIGISNFPQGLLMEFGVELDAYDLVGIFICYDMGPRFFSLVWKMPQLVTFHDKQKEPRLFSNPTFIPTSKKADDFR